MSAATVSFARRRYKRRKAKNIVCCTLLGMAALVALWPLLSVFRYVIIEGLPALRPQLFTALPKPVGESGGGMANSLVGTAILVFLASVVGIPWGISTGVYLAEYGDSRWARLVRNCVELLTSVPSLIMGLFVYALMVVPMKRFSALAGGLALAIIMIPTVARTTEDLLRLVPKHIREAGLALGLPRWKVTLQVVLRGSLKAIATGVMLSIARVSGETAPLLFTALNNSFWPSPLWRLDQPISSLPVQIYTYSISPFEEWHRQAWAGALVLMLFVFSINIVTRWALRSAGRISE